MKMTKRYTISFEIEHAYDCDKAIQELEGIATNIRERQAAKDAEYSFRHTMNWVQEKIAMTAGILNPTVDFGDDQMDMAFGQIAYVAARGNVEDAEKIWAASAAFDSCKNPEYRPSESWLSLPSEHWVKVRKFWHTDHRGASREEFADQIRQLQFGDH
jgi:hypothetical protein